MPSEVPARAPFARPSLPRVIVVSAGTNDDPGAVSRFARVRARDGCGRRALAVRRLVDDRAAPVRGCLLRGVQPGAPQRSRAAGANLRVFDWDAMARSHPAWFGRDGVHPTATGYRARAAAIARLVQRCGT